MAKLSVKDVPVQGKRVLVRVDFNVPLDENQVITDESRIVGALPTIKYLLENDAKIICCSALLTTTMGEMRNVVEAVQASEMKGKVKVMIGGAPITQTFCDQIGADCYTPDAASAADAAVAYFE